MRFPLADLGQVRREVARQISAVPGAAPRFWAAIALLSLGSGANVLVPILLGRIVDIVLDGGDLPTTGLLLVVAALTAAVLSATGFYLLSRISERVIANLRDDMVGTALGLPVHRVEDAGTGDLVSRSTDDVAELSTAVTETLPILASSVFMIAATTIALFSLDWQFLLVPLVVAPIYFLAARAYLKVAPERYAGERAAMAERARRVLEAIRGRATVRAYRMEEQMHRSIDASSTDVVDKGVRARMTMMVLQMWIVVTEFIMLSVALLVGYRLATTGALSVGAVTGAALMLIRLRGPLMMIMRVLDMVQSGYASLTRIVGVVADPPAPVPDTGAPAKVGRVVMDNVSFSYGSGWAVRDVSLDIRPGETVALVGASGAGKTTVAALLAGLRVPDEGTVRIDGVEVSSLSDAERVARLAMISQDVHVFSGTLREDLTLARPEATDAELLEALARVRADWFDELPEGLDTEVGARGHQLDPVAAQQLALARILLLDPRVVVMDEATAESGSVGAGNLEAAAEEVTRDRAALVVAHRLDQAARADQVLVMAEGKVVEHGTHEELVARGGRYTELWSAWSRGRV
ncbi:ABC transporter ATP-binding protein/permease [Corynebacterium sp. YIM 101645]|uniref:ABC transporter ATP-binding protein/permease n=1 Tax=Corynebacterium lemuris TaxID=1859292 RepID=A0ABT2FVZ6_9CORY|nr:ABC transporter ATP-binding protein [Corynebacterium lemuris]MCS5479415.1 ABC transporter ATP-binding protein/permease [Corynebacterium lemuris]